MKVLLREYTCLVQTTTYKQQGWLYLFILSYSYLLEWYLTVLTIYITDTDTLNKELSSHEQTLEKKSWMNLANLSRFLIKS